MVFSAFKKMTSHRHTPQEPDDISSGFSRTRKVVGWQSVPGILAILLAGYMINETYKNSIVLNDDIQGIIRDLNTMAEQLSSDNDLAVIVEMLDTASSVEGQQQSTWAVPLLDIAVEQDVLDDNYRQLAVKLLRPKVLLRLEDQMRENINNPSYLYQALQVYLMVGQALPMDTDLVRTWVQLDWEQTYPGQALRRLRSNLGTHFDVVLENATLSDFTLNGALVSEVRQTLLRQPTSDRIYEAIINDSKALSLSPWRVGSAAGPDAGQVFVRQSGAPLSSGSEGIFTRDAFIDYFLPSVFSISVFLREQDGILGIGDINANDETQLASLMLEVIARYEADYVATWNVVLSDLQTVSITSLTQAAEITGIASGPTSPIEKLLTSVSRETQLTDAWDEFYEVASISRETEVIGQIVAGIFGPALDIVNEGEATNEDDRTMSPGGHVTAHFAPLHRFVESPEEGPETGLQQFVGTLGRVQKEANSLLLGEEDDQTSLAKVFDAFNPDVSEYTLPLYVADWAQQIKQGTMNTTLVPLRDQLNMIWTTDVLQACINVSAGNFPFTPTSPRAPSILEFASVFSRGGAIDEFVLRHLTQYIDYGQSPWAWRGVAKEAGLSKETLLQLQRAAQIQSGLFGRPTNMPFVTYFVTQRPTSDNVARAVLKLGATTLEFSADNPSLPSGERVDWPDDLNTARLQLFDANNNVIGDRQESGPWASLRLLRSAQIQPLENRAEHFVLSFTINNEEVEYSIATSAPVNPLLDGTFDSFVCPASF
ncbi:MAG: ImcF-related family protein [Roseobacter sp.]